MKIQCNQAIPSDMLLSFRDLGFDRVPVRAYSSRGIPYERSIPVGMPKIPQNARNAAFYLYPSKADAEKGENFGGTGFLVLVPSERHGKYGRGYIYAVTNWHVACQSGSSVIRLNTKSGKPDILEYGPDEWYFDPRYDIAVRQIILHSDVHAATAIHYEMLLTPAGAASAEIGPGDDVFMVGRFIDHDGGEVNRPAVRFGHISIDPTPIEQPNNRKTDCYCIDIHSRTGYSGSPVFAYRLPGSDLSRGHDPNAPALLMAGANFFMLLGIHIAQFPELWEVTEKGKLRHETAEPLLTDGKFIKGFSGMTVVIPAWRIREILDSPTFKKARDMADEKAAEEFRKNGYPPEAESSGGSAPEAKDANPQHREDFTSLLGEAARKQQQGG